MDLPLACFALAALVPVDLEVDGAPPIVVWPGGYAKENTQAQDSNRCDGLLLGLSEAGLCQGLGTWRSWTLTVRFG